MVSEREREGGNVKEKIKIHSKRENIKRESKNSQWEREKECRERKLKFIVRERECKERKWK